MDPISIGIIVIVLSLGTGLLFLFKVDFAKNNYKRQHQPDKHGGIISHNQLGSKKSKQKTSCLLNPSSHSHQTIVVKQNGSPATPKKSCLVSTNSGDSVRAKKISPTSTETKKKVVFEKDIPDLLVGHETKPQKNVSPTTTSTTTTTTTTTTSISKMAKKKEPKFLSAPTKVAEVSDFSEPAVDDELDSSIAMEIFNHSNGIRQSGKSSSKTPKRQMATFDNESFESLDRGRRSTTPSYSSEQLFTMIAASNLSKDEVEFAVEMLLDKIDSGDSDWKRPKSDPVERLKNQLRDSENVLSVEIQNHEQTRARLVELRGQLQGERQSSSKFEEESMKLRKELSIANLALEQTRADLARLQSVVKQRDDDGAKMISILEREKLQLQTILAEDSARGGDYDALRAKFDEKLIQLQRYELNQQKMTERMADLEGKLRISDHLVDELRASKQHDDYEASAKISELKSDRIQLDKALKDQMTRFKEISEANSLLGKTIDELRIINARQDEMVKQMTDERQVHEASMKRTLQEMEQELRELQQKLNANSLSLSSQQTGSERAHRDGRDNQTGGGEREQKLISEMNQLRDALASLFPDSVSRTSSASQSNGKSTDWVQEYLVALKQLSATLDELNEPNNNNNKNDNNNAGANNGESHSPKRKSMSTNKATSTPRKNASSPTTSNGRSSRGEFSLSLILLQSSLSSTGAEN